MSTAYDFSFHQPTGNSFPLASLQGKVILVVNTASECGFTKQYAELESLYQAYKDQGLVILAVPSNDFGKQEPGSDSEIQRFCHVNYGLSFPVLRKEIVSGKGAHPFYLWAKSQLGLGSSPKWNFHKYLISREGQLVDYFLPMTSPQAVKVKRAIEALL